MTHAQSYAHPTPSKRRWLASVGMLVIAALTTPAYAAFDIYGGQGGSSQTIHHCGWIQARPTIYTQSHTTTAIIQRKLSNLGYYAGAVDGVNTPLTHAAVMQFQREYGLDADGIVGSETATAIGYVANGADWVRSCHRPYGRVAMR